MATDAPFASDGATMINLTCFIAVTAAKPEAPDGPAPGRHRRICPGAQRPKSPAGWVSNGVVMGNRLLVADENWAHVAFLSKPLVTVGTDPFDDGIQRQSCAETVRGVVTEETKQFRAGSKSLGAGLGGKNPNSEDFLQT